MSSKAEEVKQKDKGINTMAVGLSFITLGIFLFFNNNFLNNEAFSDAFGVFLTSLGSGYFFLGLEKNNNIKTKYIGVGIIFIGLWAMGLFWINNIIYNIAGLVFMFFGFGGVYMGILNLLEYRTSNNNTKKEPLLKVMILYLTGIASFAWTIIQILNNL